MKVILFQDRFAALVASGEKRQTIRAPRKRPLVVGESVSLRRWSGRPYCSKQIELLTARINRLSEIEIRGEPCADIAVTLLRGIPLSLPSCEALARADGFETFAEMLDWFQKNHGLPFQGVLVEWESAS